MPIKSQARDQLTAVEFIFRGRSKGRTINRYLVKVQVYMATSAYKGPCRLDIQKIGPLPMKAHPYIVIISTNNAACKDEY